MESTNNCPLILARELRLEQKIMRPFKARVVQLRGNWQKNRYQHQGAYKSSYIIIN